MQRNTRFVSQDVAGIRTPIPLPFMSSFSSPLLNGGCRSFFFYKVQSPIIVAFSILIFSFPLFLSLSTCLYHSIKNNHGLTYLHRHTAECSLNIYDHTHLHDTSLLHASALPTPTSLCSNHSYQNILDSNSRLKWCIFVSQSQPPPLLSFQKVPFTFQHVSIK